jgi:bifunctional non-homologous end joining protein LigD
MALEKYGRMRDFAKTAEPPPRVRRGERHRFVVQKHAASHLHYDFRLEHEGVLKSWAVPKGPTYDTGEKRLAVQVEDHPVAYADFEGTIPAGEYGGGSVIVWDRGTWEPEGDIDAGLRAGKLHFALHGTKLRGRWLLMRMGKDGRHWLLRKVQDEIVASGDVVEEAPRSVISGRTVEDVAAGVAAREGPGRTTKKKRTAQRGRAHS